MCSGCHVLDRNVRGSWTSHDLKIVEFNKNNEQICFVLRFSMYFSTVYLRSTMGFFSNSEVSPDRISLAGKRPAKLRYSKRNPSLIVNMHSSVRWDYSPLHLIFNSMDSPLVQVSPAGAGVLRKIEALDLARALWTVKCRSWALAYCLLFFTSCTKLLPTTFDTLALHSNCCG